MLLEHNVPVYNKLQDTLLNNDNNCAIVVMGTGVGKTYITREFLEQNGLKGLVVSPRRSINDSWKKVCGDMVEAITYQKLARISERIGEEEERTFFSQYDLVICDEVHHIGAPKWGKFIDALLKKKIIKVLGLTENPIRYTDGGRNVGIEFFESKFCYGESVASAIEKKVLNSVTYIGALYNTDGIREQFRGKIVDKLYNKLDLALNNTPSVHEIIKRNIPSAPKGIIFASTIGEIPEAIKLIKDVYPDIDIRPVHSKQSNVINEQAIEWFNGVSTGFLCSVDMLSEGVHLRGVNTLFMLRRTESPNVFAQQLGRCLSASMGGNGGGNAVVFDLVNNKLNVKESSGRLSVHIPNILDETGLNESAPSSQLIVKDYTKNVVDVLHEIDDALTGRWTNAEVEILKKNYGKMLNADLAKLIPNHTALAIERKAGYLGLSDAGLWTKEEIQILQDWYLMNKNKCLKKLRKIGCKKSVQAIRTKARRMGLASTDNLYTPEEDEIIKAYAGQGAKFVVEELVRRGFKLRSKVAVRARARKYLGVQIGVKPPRIRCVETGVVYENCLVAERETGVANSSIYQCCKHNKKTAGGYHWEYEVKKK